MEPANEIPSVNWTNYHGNDTFLFRRKPTKKESSQLEGCFYNRTTLSKCVPLYGIPSSVVFNNSPRSHYGCFSNSYPLKQNFSLSGRIKPFADLFKSYGFSATLACAAIGFTLLRVLEDGNNNPNSIKNNFLQIIFEVNANCLKIIDRHGDINAWMKTEISNQNRTGVKAKNDAQDNWDKELEKITVINKALPYPFSVEKEKIIYQRFVDEVLFPKFTTNVEIKDKLLSVKGFIIYARRGDVLYGINQHLNHAIDALKLAEAEGVFPNDLTLHKLDGKNLQGRALEAVRDKIIREVSELPSINWFKYHNEGTFTFKSTPNCGITPCKAGSMTDKCFKSIPLYGIPNSIAFNSSKKHYGCFSNFYPQLQTVLLSETVKPFEEIIRKHGFEGQLACSAIGFALLRLLIASNNNPEELNIQILKSIIDTNKFLLEIIKKHGDDINKWENSLTGKKTVKKSSVFNDWNLKLIAMMQVASKIILTPQQEVIFYRNFTDQVLYPKFKENEKIREVLRSVKGFIFEAACGDLNYEIGESIPVTVDEVKLAESEGRLPKFKGKNLQGLALEEVRDRIEKELKLENQSTQNLEQTLSNQLKSPKEPSLVKASANRTRLINNNAPTPKLDASAKTFVKSNNEDNQEIWNGIHPASYPQNYNPEFYQHPWGPAYNQPYGYPALYPQYGTPSIYNQQPWNPAFTQPNWNPAFNPHIGNGHFNQFQNSQPIILNQQAGNNINRESLSNVLPNVRIPNDLNDEYKIVIEVKIEKNIE